MNDATFPIAYATSKSFCPWGRLSFVDGVGIPDRISNRVSESTRMNYSPTSDKARFFELVPVPAKTRRDETKKERKI
jgi:hypothetical protein